MFVLAAFKWLPLLSINSSFRFSGDASCEMGCIVVILLFLKCSLNCSVGSYIKLSYLNVSATLGS